MHSPDKDPKRAVQFLANYASGRAAALRLAMLCTPVWSTTGLRCTTRRALFVERKSDMNSHVYLALFVANAPTGTSVGEIECLFEKFGPLHSNPRVATSRQHGITCCLYSCMQTNITRD